MYKNSNKIGKKCIQYALKWLAKVYLWRYKPYVIIVAGATNRHWVKEEIVKALKEKVLDSRASRKNFNAEIGLPLSILDLPSGEGSFKNWLKILWQGIKKVVSRQLSVIGQDYLVLETAISHPEDMDYLLSIVKPQAAILTTIVTVYRENFEDLDEVALEYQKLVEILPKGGLLLLNYDDERIKNLSRFSPCRTITYGLNDGADCQAKNVKKVVDGQEFEINSVPTKINRFGKHHIYAKITAHAIRSEKF